MAARTLIAKLAFSPMSSLRIVRPSSSLLRVRSFTASPFLRLPIVCFAELGYSYKKIVPLSPHGLSQALDRFIILAPADDCDSEHWLVFLEPSEPSLTEDQITVSYIKTLAEVLGSVEEAKKSIYSVNHLAFAFGCIASRELSYKIKTLPKVREVLPDPFFRPFRRSVKTEVQDNPQDRYSQRQSENMQKYHDDGLDRDFDMQMWDFKDRGSPRKRDFLLQPTSQLVDKGYGYLGRVNYYQGGRCGGFGDLANNSYQGHGPGYQGDAPAYQGRGLLKEVMAVTLKRVGRLRASWARL